MKNTETKQDNEILPCWRCGSPASTKGHGGFLEQDPGAWFVRCDNRHCNAESHVFTRPNLAVRWWNRRT